MGPHGAPWAPGPLRGAAVAAPLRCPGPFSAAMAPQGSPGAQGPNTPSEFVSSLRTPLAEHMPFLPRPPLSEAHRSGLFSTHVGTSTVREKYVAFRGKGTADMADEHDARLGATAPPAVEERVKAARERLAQKLAMWGETGSDRPPSPKKKVRRKASSK